MADAIVPTLIGVDHADALGDVRGLIRKRLIDGTYDVLWNHHEDVLEVDAGERHLTHPLTRPEAETIERAIWSAGEDETLTILMTGIERGLLAAGFNLVGDHLDITIRLRQAVPEA